MILALHEEFRHDVAILQASFLFKKSLSAWLNVTFANDGIGDI